MPWFKSFSGILHHFVLAKLASSIRVDSLAKVLCRALMSMLYRLTQHGSPPNVLMAFSEDNRPTAKASELARGTGNFSSLSCLVHFRSISRR